MKFIRWRVEKAYALAEVFVVAVVLVVETAVAKIVLVRESKERFI